MPFRCSRASENRLEAITGTASTVRAFLLVETPGAWGVDAFAGGRSDDAARRHLAAEAKRHRVRPLMIRRHGRSAPEQLTVFAAFADPAQPWVETTCVADPAELLDLDLARLGAGHSPGLEPHPDPLFLVCTHGKHDACCAERGRPLASALSRVQPECTWEVSHIGGDRFAGNMLVLPEGLYYGRLSPPDAVAVADRHRSGHLDLEHLRGRCSYPFAVQAAETFLRAELGSTELSAVGLLSVTRDSDETTAVFAAGAGSWQVVVRTVGAAAEQLTCRAARTNPGVVHTLGSITPQ
ncbi:MAG TPA: sucrase ferredoxin [Nocardioidaceae bacterium]|nr:sucrase ferredoxin [Nocardioidaceae bacterium]